MPKIDLRKEMKALYSPSAKAPELVEVPPLRFLMVDGVGDPNTRPEFGQATEVLYSLSYTLKFMLKKGPEAIDYGVLPLEALWWAGDSATFRLDDRTDWHWTAMIAQPQWITEALLQEAVAQVRKKKDLPALPLVRMERYHEGLSAQIMHLGPYAAEAPTIARLHEFISAQGYRCAGKHHEIYLSDPHRSAPEKMRTIIRQPVSK